MTIDITTDHRAAKMEEIFLKEFGDSEKSVQKQIKRVRRKFSLWRKQKENRKNVANLKSAVDSLARDLDTMRGFLAEDFAEDLETYAKLLPFRGEVRGEVVVDITKDKDDDEIIPTQDLTKTEDPDLDYSQIKVCKAETEDSQAASTEQLFLLDTVEQGEITQTDHGNVDAHSETILANNILQQEDKPDSPTGHMTESNADGDLHNFLEFRKTPAEERRDEDGDSAFEDDAGADPWRLSLPPAAADRIRQVTRMVECTDCGDEIPINDMDLHLQHSCSARARSTTPSNAASDKEQDERSSSSLKDSRSTPVKSVHIRSRRNAEDEHSNSAKSSVSSLAQPSTESVARPSKKPRVKEENEDSYLMDIYSLTHDDIAIPKSTGRPRKAMANLLDQRFGIHASMTSQSAICTNRNRISHLVLDDKWNDFCYDRNENQVLYVGTGNRRSAVARILLNTTAPFPVFFHPKRNNVRHCIFYVGHFRVDEKKSEWFDEPRPFKKHDRVCRIEMAYDSFDERIVEAVQPPLININFS